MAKCEICDKGQHFGIKVSHSHRRTNRVWKPNVRKVKVSIDGVSRRMNICADCLRSSKLTKSV